MKFVVGSWLTGEKYFKPFKNQARSPYFIKLKILDHKNLFSIFGHRVAERVTQFKFLACLLMSRL